MAADFERAATAAAQLLLKQKLYSLRINTEALKYDINIIFDTFTSFCEKSRATVSELESRCNSRDGCTIIRENGNGSVYIILYNEKVKSPGRRNFTLAHEIGHIYLGHNCDGADEESEADFFAAQLLLPPALVWELLKRSNFTLSARELAGIFGTSTMAAENRLKNLKSQKFPVFSSDQMLLHKKFGGLLPFFDGPIIDF